MTQSGHRNSSMIRAQFREWRSCHRKTVIVTRQRSSRAWRMLTVFGVSIYSSAPMDLSASKSFVEIQRTPDAGPYWVTIRNTATPRSTTHYARPRQISRGFPHHSKASESRLRALSGHHGPFDRCPLKSGHRPMTQSGHERNWTLILGLPFQLSRMAETCRLSSA